MVSHQAVLLTKDLSPVLNNEENVSNPDGVTVVRSAAPSMKANRPAHLFPDNDVQFWRDAIWPGNLPNLNVAEHIGSIIKDEVEKRCYPTPDTIVLLTQHSRRGFKLL